MPPSSIEKLPSKLTDWVTGVVGMELCVSFHKPRSQTLAKYNHSQQGQELKTSKNSETFHLCKSTKCSVGQLALCAFTQRLASVTPLWLPQRT